MILFPAIDLKDGQCVRLRQGEMAQATVFNADPAAQARAFEAQGFEWLHVVDLNGAFAGKPVNEKAVDGILQAVAFQCSSAAAFAISTPSWPGSDKGIDRVILGTAAVRDPALVREAARDFPGCIAVGIDARDGKVAIEGWAETSEMTALELARRFEDAGVAAHHLYRHCPRRRAGRAQSGGDRRAGRGRRDPGDRQRRACLHRGRRALLEPRYAMLEGAIAGRALYDGRLDPAAALALIAARQTRCKVRARDSHARPHRPHHPARSDRPDRVRAGHHRRRQPGDRRGVRLPGRSQPRHSLA